MQTIRFLVLASAIWLAGAAWAQTESLTGAERDFFENRIRPALVKYCYECHSSESDEAGGKLLLDSKRGLRQGGESGRIVIDRDPDASLLIQALRWDGTEMPPEQPVPASVLRDFEKWVQSGAPNPRADEELGLETPRDGSMPPQRHWAFQPIRFPRAPSVGMGWARDPIDQFVFSRLIQKELKPTRDAPARTLVRRLFYDLIGLPPSKSQIDRWSVRITGAQQYANAAPVGLLNRRAIEALVDELLASPHFGERWGRHWLDVARYGESNGNDGLARNATFPHAWRYRDYVIRALNRDTPYDRFIAEQIAGDLLPAKSDTESDWNKIATGFLALGSKPASAMNVNFNMDVVADQIGVVSSGIMGLSVGCARCHDHKHDPIPTRDYYAMAGIFTSTTTMWGAAANEKLTAPPTPLHELKVLKRSDTSLPEIGPGLPAFPDGYSEVIRSLQPAIYSKLDAPHADLRPEDGAKMSPATFATMGKGRIRGKVRQQTDSYSVSFWFRNDLKSSSVIMTAYLFSFANRAKLEGVGDHLGLSGTYQGADPGHLFVFPGVKDVPSVTGAAVIPERTWNHVVLVREKDRVRLQLNGVENLDIDAELPPASEEVREFTLGSRSDGMFSLQGNMTEFAFFDRALSPQEAKLLHSASGQPERSGPVQPAPIVPSPNNLAMGVREATTAGDCKININGESQKLGESVPRGFLSAWTEPKPPVVIPADKELRPFLSSMSEASRVGKPKWTITKGTISGTANAAESGFLTSREEFLDFDLQCDFQLQGKGTFNSGISFRFDAKPGSAPHFNLGKASEGEPFGVFYGEWKLKAVPEEEIELEQWNRLRLKVAGEKVQGWINDELLVDYTLERKNLPAGKIALQSAAGKGESGKIRFRNLKVQRLNESLRPYSPVKDPKASGRMELVQWLVDREHPLTARVMVNRVWHHLMGQPLVSTPDDFGFYGSRPSHPQLLDHLATRFIENGWSIKQLIRDIVLTRTYGLDSLCDSQTARFDPDNKWLARHSRRRLDAEAIRDSILMASGQLNLQPGTGSDVQHLDVQVNQVGDTLHRPSKHRSIYLCMLRNSPPPDLAAFDLPDALEVKGRRDVTLQPTQSLYLLNSKFLVEQSQELAAQLVGKPGQNESQRIIQAYERVLTRTPEQWELETASALLRGLRADLEESSARMMQVELRSWTALCQALFLASEFRYVD